MQVKGKVASGLLFVLLFACGVFAQSKTLVWSLTDPAHSDVWTEPETGQKLLRISNNGVLVSHDLWSADKHGVMVIFYVTDNRTQPILFRFSDFAGVVSSPRFESLNLSPLSSYAKILKPGAMQEQQAYMTNPSQPIALGPSTSEFIPALFDKPRTKPAKFQELRFMITINDTEYIFPDHFGVTGTPTRAQSAPQEPVTSATQRVPCASTAPSASRAEIPLEVISFATADPKGGVHPGMAAWTENWIRKNAKRYPNVLFQQGCPVWGAQNYLIVFSTSASALSGFDPVVKTNTSTSTTPVSGSGTITDNYGSTWDYTFDGDVTTATTTTTQEDVPYTIRSNTLYATAYDEHGVIVSQRWHVYNSKQGGDAANSLGYNLGSALAAINSRGRLLNAVVKDIAGKKKK